MTDYIQAHINMACAGILAMPNTKPPVSRVTGTSTDEYWTIESYLTDLRASGGDVFSDIIVPLYLTRETTPDMIREGVKSGYLRAAKYYPPHGTTNSDHGFPLRHFMENGVFSAMADTGVVLCLHGEEHGLAGADYFDRDTNAEDVFYTRHMPVLVQKFPNLKIVCEHITTRTAAEFVSAQGDNVCATVTPQHLLYTAGHLLQGFKYHLYCLPLVKFNTDRAALRDAVTSPANTRFFAGTDSAPHALKATACGCAAGCFTGNIAPQLYAQAFEDSGVDLATKDGQTLFQRFLCDNGPRFYGLTIPDRRFTLTKTPSPVHILTTREGTDIIPLPLGMGQDTLPWTLER